MVDYTMKIFLLMVVIMMLTACSSTSHQEQHQSVVAETSKHAIKGNEADETSTTKLLTLTGVDNMFEGFSYWQLKKSRGPRHPSTDKNDYGCVEADFTVNQQGKVEDIVVTYAYPQAKYEQSVIEALKYWQWQPTDLNKDKQPVRMTTFFVFEHTHKDFGLHCKKYQLEMS